jgi:hypothetical protein
MKKVILFGTSFFITLFVLGQNKKKISGVFYAQANVTAYDRVVMINKSGPGLGLTLLYKTKRKIKPQVDVSLGAFSGNKILIFENGMELLPKSFVVTSFAGFVYYPVSFIEAGLCAGPSFFNGDVHWGIKPSLGVYLNKKKTIKTFGSLTHIYQRDEISKKSFGFISAGLGIKLF